VKLVAGWYFVAAFVVLVMSMDATVLSPWLMTVPFLIGQVFMAIVLALSGNSADD